MTGSGTTSSTYGYNLDRQLESLLRPDGESISRSYDSVTGKLTSLVLPTGTSAYSYDATSGRLVGITGPYAVDLSYGYDGRLRTDVTWSGDISGTVHTDYDNDFRAAVETVNGASAISFDYDDDGLLTSAGALSRTLEPATAQLTNNRRGGRIGELWLQRLRRAGELRRIVSQHFDAFRDAHGPRCAGQDHEQDRNDRRRNAHLRVPV